MEKEFKIPLYKIYVAVAAIIAGIFIIVWKGLGPEDIHYFIQNISNLKFKWTLSCLIWGSTGVFHAICLSVEKSKKHKIHTDIYFDWNVWLVSLFLVSGLCFMSVSTIGVLSGVIGEMVGKDKFLVENDNFHLTSMLIVSLLITLYTAVRYARLIGDITRVIKDLKKT